MKQDRIQDLRALESRLYEAVQEAVDEKDTALFTDCGEPSYDAVADIAAEYCYVR